MLDLLKVYSKSERNRLRIQNLSILHSSKVLNYHLDLLQEFQSIESDSNFPSFEYIDLSNVITYLKIDNSVLAEDHIFDIYTSTNWVNKLIHFIINNEYHIPNIEELTADLKKSNIIKKRIEKSLLTEDSSVLMLHKPSKIRDDISEKHRLVDKSFKDSKIHYMQLGYLADIKESFAEGISLLAISSEFKRKSKDVSVASRRQKYNIY